jgi:hypothetical protein
MDSYEFDTYKKFSLSFYTVLMGYADELQAVSVDEALIDVTTAVRAKEMAPEEHADIDPSVNPSSKTPRPRDAALELAEMIRNDVRKLTECEGESNSLSRPDSSINRYIAQCPPRQVSYKSSKTSRRISSNRISRPPIPRRFRCQRSPVDRTLDCQQDRREIRDYEMWSFTRDWEIGTSEDTRSENGRDGIWVSEGC